MSELELFAEQTIKQGGVWFKLEQKGDYKLYETYSKYCDGRNYYNGPVVYQIFDKNGKRIFATQSYQNAVTKMKLLNE